MQHSDNPNADSVGPVAKVSGLKLTISTADNPDLVKELADINPGDERDVEFTKAKLVSKSGDQCVWELTGILFEQPDEEEEEEEEGEDEAETEEPNEDKAQSGDGNAMMPPSQYPTTGAGLPLNMSAPMGASGGITPPILKVIKHRK